MKRAFLLIVVPALLVALGFAQTPAASSNTDQTIKGCLGGSDGNYTVVQDNTGHIFKITTSSVDLKAHLGHDVTLIGHSASGASSTATDNTIAVTELNMISEHCTAAAAAPTAAVSAPSETASISAAAAPAAPVGTTSTLAETEVTPAVAAAAPAATVAPPAEIAVTPAVAAIPPAETAVAPVVAATPPAEIAATPSTDVAAAKRLPARSRRLSAAPAAATTTPPVTASTSSEPASTPGTAATTPPATASTSSEPVSPPAPVVTAPTATSRGRSLWLLIAFGVLVIVIGTLVPFLSRWRKQRSLEQTGAPNLSFTREAKSDPGKSDPKGPRKAA
jgi:hypothetical protein